MTSKAENTEIIKESWDGKELVIYEAIKKPIGISKDRGGAIYVPKELIGKRVRVEYSGVEK